MVDYKKVIKDTLKGELQEIKDFMKLIKPNIHTRVKKAIKKQQRQESRVAQRTGNQYMIGKKTTKVKPKDKTSPSKKGGR